MKNKIIITSALLCLSILTFAQKSLSGTVNTAAKAAVATDGADVVSNLFKQFKSAFNADAFSSNFNATAWEKKNTSAKSVSGWAGSVIGLYNGLKEDAFKADTKSAREKWLANAKSATTTQQVSKLTAELEGYINPKYLNSDWTKQRAGWLGTLKKISAAQ